MGIVCVCVGGGVWYADDDEVSCSRKQHSASGEARNSDPSLNSTTDCITSLEL